ncbi:RagB/SusD family nutrient uptake outer membrane protein [Rapidithrix thailandica]|uniref:RagB/SusD family nutrient uptake outer membrane protein n=1 Tax=Rapidithrix thailandica TaxID=413964 RepID=A0AAW9RYC7_9BACT
MKCKFIYILLSLFLLSACQDDFLDRTPGDQISSEIFFTQEKDFLFALNAVYDALDGEALLWYESWTDNAKTNHSWNPGFYMARGSGDASDGFVASQWGRYFSAIQGANRIINNIDKPEHFDPDVKAEVLGQAKFLRAYFYHEVTMLFGNVPLLLESITPEEAKEVSKTSQTEILSFLARELSEAEAMLPVSYSDTEKGRATKGAALALKARILLFNHNYAEAAEAAEAVINLNTYELYPDYFKLFTSYEAEYSNENVFDAQYNGEDNVDNWITQNWAAQSGGGWSVTTPTRSLVDAYECTDGLPIDKSPLYDWENPYENRDPRLAMSILYPGREWLGGVYNTVPGATYPGKDVVNGDALGDGYGQEWNKTKTGYNWLKNLRLEDLGTDNVWDGAGNVYLIRYAEVLLTYAEAKIEAGSIDASVLEAINTVRDRAGMPAVTTTDQAALREIVRRERRVELAFEGLRLFDIRRWKVAEEVLNTKVFGIYYVNTESGERDSLFVEERSFNKERDYLWPIPQEEIDVSGIEQNPGW